MSRAIYTLIIFFIAVVEVKYNNVSLFLTNMDKSIVMMWWRWHKVCSTKAFLFMALSWLFIIPLFVRIIISTMIIITGDSLRWARKSRRMLKTMFHAFVYFCTTTTSNCGTGGGSGIKLHVSFHHPYIFKRFKVLFIRKATSTVIKQVVSFITLSGGFHVLTHSAHCTAEKNTSQQEKKAKLTTIFSRENKRRNERPLVFLSLRFQ